MPASRRAAKEPPKRRRSAKGAPKRAPRVSPNGQSLGPERVMGLLRRHGSERTAATYRRRGAAGAVFGVGPAYLKTLARRIGTDHALASDLWTTGNFDAQSLASRIADPAAFTEGELDAWAAAVTSRTIAYTFAEIAAATPHAPTRIRAWTASADEFVRRCGYQTLAAYLRDGREISAGELRRHLVRIEKQIAGAPIWVREGMKFALIAIGAYRPGLRPVVVAAMKRMGQAAADARRAARPGSRGGVRQAIVIVGGSRLGGGARERAMRR